MFNSEKMDLIENVIKRFADRMLLECHLYKMLEKLNKPEL